MRDLTCACGAPFRSCHFWSRATSGLISQPQETIQEFLSVRDGFTTIDSLLRTVPGRKTRDLDGQLKRYAEALGSIYSRIGEVNQTCVIVDSSKFPSHGIVASLIPDIDLYVLHLVRDPRAVAFSWQRKKLYDPGQQKPRYMRRYGGVGSTLHWVLRNVTTERLWKERRITGRYMRLRYEDFARRPCESIQLIASFLGERPSLDFFVGSHTAVLRETHELSGNPSRFSSGRIEMSPDQEWTNKMPLHQRVFISTLAAPWMLRYGYIRTGRRKPFKEL